jgi:hypothetical protein
MNNRINKGGRGVHNKTQSNVRNVCATIFTPVQNLEKIQL